ncbi:protein S-acyltransferase 16 isoform X4 [Populus alba x Populus x berolinensis]|nr:protein S-acyltransferase 16 isoform X4 [Populus alba x Populus x berolinensis]
MVDFGMFSVIIELILMVVSCHNVLLHTCVIEGQAKGGDLRYCQKCSHFKPPRAHHCRVCKRCVLRMVLLLGSLTVDPQKHELNNVDSFRTIYFHEGVRAMWLAEKEGHVYKHPYDVGAYENLTTVLGPSISCWVCPTSGHIGSGLHFRTAYDGMSSASV